MGGRHEEVPWLRIRSSSLLPQVRTLVRERLGENSLLDSSGHAAKGRKKRAANARRRSSSGLKDKRASEGISSDVASSQGPAADSGSVVSGYTYGTATTFRTKQSQPDEHRMPSEYEKVRYRDAYRLCVPCCTVTSFLGDACT